MGYLMPLQIWSASNVSNRTSNIRTLSMFVTKTKKLISVALVRERTIPTKGPPLVGEIRANFCGERVSRGQRNGFPRSLISVF
jgi:hypothetical protein